MPDDEPVPAPASDELEPGDFEDPPPPPPAPGPDDVVQAVADFVDDLVLDTDDDNHRDDDNAAEGT